MFKLILLSSALVLASSCAVFSGESARTYLSGSFVTLENTTSTDLTSPRTVISGQGLIASSATTPCKLDTTNSTPSRNVWVCSSLSLVLETGEKSLISVNVLAVTWNTSYYVPGERIPRFAR